jgi:hypothetical protein
MFMKKKLKFVSLGLIASAIALQCAQAYAHDNPQANGHDNPQARRGCDVAMLRGLYLLKGSGQAVVNGAVVPKALLGSVRFNGDGTLVVETLTLTVLNLPPLEQVDSPGNYTVESNCTGTLAIPGGPTWNIFVSSRAYATQIQTGGPDHGITLADLRYISR